MDSAEAARAAPKTRLPPPPNGVLVVLGAAYVLELLPLRFGKPLSPIAAAAAAGVTIAFCTLLWRHRLGRWWVGAIVGMGCAALLYGRLGFLSRVAHYA